MSSNRYHPFTFMSAHALRRVQQRTKMSASEIGALLDKGLYVDIGRKPGFNRHHLVFYSRRDDCCFVAIRDECTGTVVTVLPLAYQARLAWPVRAEDEQSARRLAIRSPSARSLHLKAALRKKTPKKFQISAQYMDSQGDRHTQYLATFPSAPYGDDHGLLLKNAAVQERLDWALKGLGVNPGAILTLYVCLGGDEVAAIDFGH